VGTTDLKVLSFPLFSVLQLLLEYFTQVAGVKSGYYRRSCDKGGLLWIILHTVTYS